MTDETVPRTEFEQNSSRVLLPEGNALHIGQTVMAVNETLNGNGVTQVQYADGWLSAEAGDGTVQLQKIEQAIALECIETSIPGRCRCNLPDSNDDSIQFDQMFMWLEQRPASQTSTTARDIVLSIDVWLPSDGPTMASSLLTISDRVLGDPIRFDDSCPHGWYNFDGGCYR